MRELVEVLLLLIFGRLVGLNSLLGPTTAGTGDVTKRHLSCAKRDDLVGLESFAMYYFRETG